MAILQECPACHKKQAVANKRCSCGWNLDRAKKSRQVKYWLSYYIGKRKRREVAGYSIDEARDADAKKKILKRENRFFDIVPEAKMTFSELAKWYTGLERVKSLSRFRVINQRLNAFNAVLGDTVLGDLRLSDLEGYQVKRKASVAPSTIDDEINVVKTMVNCAFDNDKIGGNVLKPFKRLKKLMKRNANARDRVLSEDEFSRLLEAVPRHIKPVLATGYYTGMRSGEILNLTWDKVDLKKGIIQLVATDTKDREPRLVPILQALSSVLRTIPRNIHDNHVFLFNGKPMQTIRRALQRACDRAGIPYGRKVKGGFIFHDLRHTFNTNMRKAGVHESVIMAITGHSTRDMFDRYNRVDTADVIGGIDTLGAYLFSRNSHQIVTKQEGGNGKLFFSWWR
jgi:integrase